ncbi:hypothetical protein N9B57_00530 [Verrucomicrobia bacterium]|jgi:hypothetical protein|nr:hypothetical protein [Verrucomicrobiota bacterium]MDA7680458.1 hypothetical protein [bacterium]MDA7866397.1 hypothetical protein [Verrucomicrobiota bacterium]
MSGQRTFRIIVLLLMALGVWGNHRTQLSLNHMRSNLHITRLEPLENAPPVLAFTTVALGGFRGLIANYLWMRAADHQENGRYFEMLSIAGWITKLQPTFHAVWNQQAWNMVYNISTQLQDPHERWLWVVSGIELLRDDGLKYNPTEPEIYRELAAIFQDKIGGTLDISHRYYKEAWATKMVQVLGRTPDLDSLVDPSTPEEVETVKRLKSEFRLDINTMKIVDDRFGPLDWRMPETHAIYWAHLGLEKCEHGRLNFLRRTIWQSLVLAFRRGTLIENFADQRLEYGPNLDLVGRVNDYFQIVRTEEEDPNYYSTIDRAYRNFLKDAVYLLYTHNRLEESATWYRQLRERFPDDPDVTQGLDQFAVTRTEAQMGRAHSDEIRAIVDGLLANHYYNLALGQEDRAIGLLNLAQRTWTHYHERIRGQNDRIGLLPFDQMRQLSLEKGLRGEAQLSDAMIIQLRSRLGLGPSSEVPIGDFN